MSGRRLWWAVLATGVAAVAAVPVAGVVGGHPWRAAADVPLTAVYVLTGAVAFRQRPDKLAARRMLLFGVLLSVSFAMGAGYSAVVSQAGVPAWSGVAVLLLGAASWANAVAALSLFAVFPDGRYRRRYERWLVRGAWCLLPVLLAAEVVGSSPLRISTPFVWLSGDVTGANRFAVAGMSSVGSAAAGALAAAEIWVAVGVVLLGLRYRGASSTTRRQISWPLYGLALTVACFAVVGSQSAAVDRLPIWAGYLIFYPILLLVPAGLLIGMLRHQLLDIEMVVRRSVVYAAMWLLITAVYVGLGWEFGLLVGRRVSLDFAVLLTIVATVVAAPVKRRLERLANRVVFGDRHNGYELLAQLGTRLETSVAPDDVVSEVVAAVELGVRASWVRVDVPAHGSTNHQVDGQPRAALEVPLLHGQEVIGTLLCGPKTSGQYSPLDEQLLSTLGRQAALAIRTAQLSAELSERLRELAASRARLVAAEEVGRRRLERDLHDGVQQELVALLARLSMGRNQLHRDSTQAEATLAQAQADARRALESLQEVVRGIHPAVLTDRGLREAVEELATRLPIRVQVAGGGLPRGVRLEPGIEGAAYYFVAETLGNALKHAQARQVCIRLSHEDGQLQVAVCDDGSGFDADTRAMRGLRGLMDRFEALGGDVSVNSVPEHGTTVLARLPAPVREHV